MTVIFDVLHLYYLPQYLPVAAQLGNKGIQVSFLFYEQADKSLNSVAEKVIEQLQIDASWVKGWDEAKQIYQTRKANWIVFGNAVSDLEVIHQYSKTALMQHGIGPKSCYYDVSKNPTTVRFIEGQHRLKRLNKLYPNGNFVDTGYAKLDPIVNREPQSLTIEKLGLDPTKKTLLYAPTFYPSSLEKFAKSFPNDFADFNILVKPHFFSQTKEKYRKQRAILNRWKKSKNVYVASIEDVSLVPFMAMADVMLSDASSAIFEFAALGKPTIWCDFYQLRWSYRGVFRFRFKKRLDSDIGFFEKVALRTKSYSALSEAVDYAASEDFSHSHEYEALIEELAGKVDGQCSVRIADYLVKNCQ